MGALDWREQMSLGYPPLDEQHKEFLTALRTADAEVKNGQVKGMDTLFDACYDYVRDHFSREEDIMERVSFPDIEAHLHSHQVFIKNISEFRGQYDTTKSMVDRLTIAQKVVSFLSVWFVGHVLSRDKLLKPYLVRLRNLPPRMDYK